jgi:hypothetical protein
MPALTALAVSAAVADEVRPRRPLIDHELVHLTEQPLILGRRPWS